MKRILIALLLVTAIGFSQEKISKNLGDFHAIKTYRGLKVELIKGNDPKILIEGNRASEVVVKNVNGVLKLSLSLTHTFSADEVMIYVYFKDKLDLIDANEGSEIYSDNVFKQERIEVRAQEAGMIKLELDTENVEVVSATGGNIKLQGKTKNQKVTANTGGMYKGSGLDSEYTDVSAATGGMADVHVSGSLDANANTGGIVNVSGDPAEVKKKESLGGYVRQ